LRPWFNFLNLEALPRGRIHVLIHAVRKPTDRTSKSAIPTIDPPSWLQRALIALNAPLQPEGASAMIPVLREGEKMDIHAIYRPFIRFFRKGRMRSFVRLLGVDG
jgi:hypothetical protein